MPLSREIKLNLVMAHKLFLYTFGFEDVFPRLCKVYVFVQTRVYMYFVVKICTNKFEMAVCVCVCVCARARELLRICLKIRGSMKRVYIEPIEKSQRIFISFYFISKSVSFINRVNMKIVNLQIRSSRKGRMHRTSKISE